MMKCGIKWVVEKRNSRIDFSEACVSDCESEGMGCGCCRSSASGLCVSASWGSRMMAGIDIGDGDSAIIKSDEPMEEPESGEF
jgi:hypothetical protein